MPEDRLWEEEMKYGRWKKRAAAFTCAAVLMCMPSYGKTQTSGAKDQEDMYSLIVGSQGYITSASADSRRYTESYSNEDDEDEDKDKTTGRTYRQSDSRTGPGSSGVPETAEEEEESYGPQVKEVPLSESYHEEFGVYEEAFNDQYFIYADVANGGITDKAVSVEIPAGVSYTMQKDGVEIPYASGQAVSARGTYVLRLTAADEKLPFSDQVIYKAAFRFRIQEKKVQETQEEQTWTGSGAGNANAWAGAPDGTGGNALGGTGGNALDGTAGNALGGTGGNALDGTAGDALDGTGGNALDGTAGNASDGTGAAGADGTLRNEGGELMDDSGKIDEEALDAAIDATLGIGEAETEPEKLAEGSGLSSFYDSESGFFKHVLVTGASFYTDVPNGMVTNNPVTIRTSDDDLSFVMYCNGEPEEYVPGEPVSNGGSYMVCPVQESADYLSDYENGGSPVFHFRIITEPVGDMGIFNAPQGMEFVQVSLDGVPVDHDYGMLYLWEDGQYEVAMRSPENAATKFPGYTVSFVKDSVAPGFYVSEEPNKAVIVYESDDVSYCRLFKDGKEVDVDGLVGEVSGSGDYMIEVYDTAGNYSTGAFRIDYQLNKAAVLVILLTALLAAAGLLIFKRIKKEVKVR